MYLYISDKYTISMNYTCSMNREACREQYSFFTPGLSAMAFAISYLLTQYSSVRSTTAGSFVYSLSKLVH